MKAKKYAVEQNVKIAVVQQTIAQQQQVRFFSVWQMSLV